MFYLTDLTLKVSKFQKQILLFSFESKNEQNHFLISALSGEFSVRQAKREVVKIKNINFPNGLEVHLEDMF